MAGKKTDLIQGTLDLLILKTVARAPIHGYGIAQRILLTSKETLQVQQGSLYPALHRLQRKGLLKSEWKESGNGPMAKRSEEHTSELQSLAYLVCRLLL